MVLKYAATKSDAVFSDIVARHLNLVYSAAMRQVRDPLMAQEITQAVFIVLAQKADSMDGNTILGGWLHRTTRFVALNALQAEQRRRQRETEAYMEQDLHTQPAESIWREMMPLLDEALSRLKPVERDAVVLRYFENRSVQEVAAALGLQENAAQKRVLRSLEKLRGFFMKRGVAVSTAAIAIVVSANSVQAAPVGLGASIVTAVHAGSTASTLALVKGTLKAMFWAKLKIPIAATTSAVIIVCGIYLAGAAPQSFIWHRDQGSPAWIVSGNAPVVEGMPRQFRGHAEMFKIYNPGALDEIQMPVQLVNGGHLNISIAADDNGVPGRIMEEFSDVAAPHVGEPESLDLHSVAHPELQKNISYWLCAEPADANTIAAWFYDTNFLPHGCAVKLGERAWASMNPRTTAKNSVGHYLNAIYRGQNYAALLVVRNGK